MSSAEIAETENNKNKLDDSNYKPLTADPNSFKLDVVELNKSPEDVFQIISKVGEGSYGSVHKALHKESNYILAIKKVPIDTDLQEIIKEITIMQQCDSKYVVKYYGSYFKNSDLWIVMEYCGAGSVSDIMRLRRKTLSEVEISAILKDTLHGLQYLHSLKKIHRDIKAGNILLNMDGNAKLADFGVAGQLTDTMAKRNTVIGTPFWMAPELIQEIGYDTKADIWSMGITAIEMAEGRPPHAEIHPMRAIFMIPTKPPPTLKNLKEWSTLFQDFISKCLIKNPEERTTAFVLLQHDFIINSKGPKVVREMIENAQDVAAQYLLQDAYFNETLESNLKKGNKREGTNYLPTIEKQQTSPHQNYEDSTLIQHNLKDDSNKNNTIKSANSEFVNDYDLNTFNYTNTLNTSDGTLLYSAPIRTNTNFNAHSYENAEVLNQNINLQSKLAAGLDHLRLNNAALSNSYAQYDENAVGCVSTFGSTSSHNFSENTINNAFYRAIHEQNTDYSFLRNLTADELIYQRDNLEKEMDAELCVLQARYHAKRQAILDAIAHKKNESIQF